LRNYISSKPDRAWPTGSWLQRRWPLYLGLAATWGLLAYLVASEPRPHSVGSIDGWTPIKYLITQAGVILHYLRLAVWPRPLIFDYDWPALLADADFFTEQFAFPWWLPSRLAEPLLRRSALARAGIAVVPGFGPNRQCDWCRQRDQDAARALSSAAEARGIPVVYYAIPATRCAPDGTPEPHRPSPGADSVYPGLDANRFVDLFQADREPAFYEVHPPPPILEDYARLLIAELRARGLLEPM